MKRENGFSNVLLGHSYVNSKILNSDILNHCIEICDSHEYIIFAGGSLRGSNSIYLSNATTKVLKIKIGTENQRWTIILKGSAGQLKALTILN